MVLDCVASFNGISLNDTINPDLELINELFDVIMRVKRYPVAISGDISKMFMQMVLDPEDQKYYRIIWDGAAYQYTREPYSKMTRPLSSQTKS